MLSPIHLSVTRMDQSKTAEVRIMQLSPQSSPIPIVVQYKFNPEILTGSPERGYQTRVGGKTSSSIMRRYLEKGMRYDQSHC